MRAAFSKVIICVFPNELFNKHLIGSAALQSVLMKKK